MKTNFLIAISILAITFSSCKKEGDASPENKTAAEEIKNFRVDVDVNSEKEESLAVYYTEDGTINFSGDKAVWAGVKGMQDQSATFNLPEEVIPTDIRLDFGLKKGSEQGDVTLKKFTFRFYGKKFEAQGSDFLKYFLPNDSTKTSIDEAKGTITFIKNPNSKMTPFYYPQQTILDEIKKMTTEK